MSRIRVPRSCDAPRGWVAPLLVAFIVAVGCVAGVGAAPSPQTAAGPEPLKQIPVGQVFTVLFLMLGPFKMLGTFFKVTSGADPRLTRQIALWATVFSAVALLIAGFLGETFLRRYGVPLPVLALSGGIIFFLVALKNVLQQFEAPEPPLAAAEIPPAAAMRIALSPLAFPGIVTPYGIAALVVIVAMSPSGEDRLTVGAVVVAITLLNLIVMLVAQRLKTVLGIALPILGAVLGIVQVALGLQIINNALRMLGVL